MKVEMRYVVRTIVLVAVAALIWSAWAPGGESDARPGAGLFQRGGHASAAVLSVEPVSVTRPGTPALTSKSDKGGKGTKPAVVLGMAPGPNAFTYQGRLLDGSVPADGEYEFVFGLWDSLSDGRQVSSPVALTNQAVSSGLFTALLDFGPTAFNGQARWLEIAVKPAGGGSFTTLSPRQPVTAAPFALGSRWEGTSGKPFPYNPGMQTNTTSTVDWSGAVGQHTGITLGTDGLGLIAYYDYVSADLKVTHCDDLGCSSATSSTVDVAGSVGSYPSITIGADGLGLISYYDASNQDLRVAHCADVECSSVTTSTVDSTGNVGQHTSITLGTDGLGLISYFDATYSNLKIAHCLNVECTSATTTRADPYRFVGQYTSIVIGLDGLGLVSYYDMTNANLKVAHCDDTACSTASAATIDASSSNVGQYSSITIGADGLGLISYFDATAGRLKGAHCADVACSSAAIATLDTSAGSGSYSSITVGADGLGVISYADTTNTNLKVAHCLNVACSSATTTTVDLAGDQGYYTSITVGVDGLPLISYSESSGTLKVAHCAGPACLNYRRGRR